jgi:hypothetical protein
VVFVVVKLHGRFVDVGLKRRVVVGQRGKFVGHGISPVVVGYVSQERPDRLVFLRCGPGVARCICGGSIDLNDDSAREGFSFFLARMYLGETFAL